MKAFALDGFGEQGSVRDLPVPDPAEGQLSLRIAVAGVNPFDAAMVRAMRGNSPSWPSTSGPEAESHPWPALPTSRASQRGESRRRTSRVA